MPTKLALEIIQRSRIALSDPTEARWRTSELLDWLNDSQREIAILRPDSSVETTAVAMVVGVSRQTLPERGIRLIDVTRNMGADGSTPGRPIRITERHQLDNSDPLWHTRTGAFVKNYIYDGKVPRTFYVYPTPSAALQVELSMQVSPADATIAGVNGATANSRISLDDLYSTAMLDYVLMRAHMKDTDAKNDQEAERAYGRFLNRLGLRVVADKSTDPNRNAPPKPPAPDSGAPNASPSF